MKTSSDQVVHQPMLGVLEWFRPGEHERVEQALDELRAIGVRELRTGVSWASFLAEGGEAWYAWLLPRLAREVRVLPCFTYTPPSLGIEPKTSAPPRTPKDYADFLDVMITRFGAHFDYVELWNEPNSINDWDWRLDPQWAIFAEMIGGAAYWCRQRGKKTVLGGMCPTDRIWLDVMCRHGVMQHIDVVGVHGFPDTWEFDWSDWSVPLTTVREVLDWHGLAPEVWITESGYATWRHDEFRQVYQFVQATETPVERVYWYALHDLHPDLPHLEGFHKDERHYHLGMIRADGMPKLLYRVLAERGVEGVRELAHLGHAARMPSPAAKDSGPGASRLDTVSVRTRRAEDAGALITGGMGFIGTNLAHRLLASGATVRIVDNLSRPGVERNLQRLLHRYGPRVQVILEDVRDPYVLRQAVRGAGQVYHLAAQVAVTTSLERPVEDFDVNLRGTLHLLEALRALADPPPLLFTSTNKVYGSLSDLVLEEHPSRYAPVDKAVRRDGISEQRPLSFYSPYGCSKGAADQYVLDYARLYDLPAVVFRMSCIYGPYQLGIEDQGWVAHFLIRALAGQPITLFGDGKQVRDVLFVDDLVEALLLAQQHAPALRGQCFNIGGGPEHTVSLLELIDHIEALQGERPAVQAGAWRLGDQRYYVSDTRTFGAATGWRPSVGLRNGLERLHRWLLQERGLAASRLVA